MPVITVSGDLGTGARDVARMIAERLGFDYVDQQLLVDAAQRLGVSVERITGRDERTLTLGERLSSVLRSFLERSAAVGATDPMIGASGLEGMLARSYEDEAEAAEPDVSDKQYKETLTAIIEGLASKGNVVIVGRGSHAVLQRQPGALHVDIVAPRDERVAYIVRRDGLDPDEAARRVDRSDRGRASYHRKLFRCEADDPAMYHLTLNAGRMSQQAMAETVVAALQAGVAATPV